MPRSPILGGLGLTLRHPRPLLWAYAFNAGLAWFTSFGLRLQFSNVTHASLLSQDMVSGFDLGSFVEVIRRVSQGPGGNFAAPFTNVPAYLLIYFLLVPGTLLTYQTGQSLRLGALLQQGVQSFWSFVRILLLTALVAGPVIAALSALQGFAGKQIDATSTGSTAILLNLPGFLVIFLAAALIRLYFDFVEIHAVSLGQTLRPGGKPDRRIRTVLGGARRTLAARFLPAYLTFLFLTLLGVAAAAFLGLSALHHLGQPRFWPILVLAQLGIFVMLFTRFWQRAAQTIHYQNINPAPVRSPIFARANPVPPPTLEPPMTSLSAAPLYASAIPLPDPIHDPLSPTLPGPDPEPFPQPDPGLDPVPNPEPIAPSLASPDEGVFHHDVPPKKDLLN